MRPDVQTCGIANETEDGFFVFVADYDGVALARVEKDLLHLNRVFGLCSFAILENSHTDIMGADGRVEPVGNYNVIGLDKLPFAVCEDAINHTRCDAAFAGHVRHYPQRNRVIRILEKVALKGKETIRPAPKLLKIVKFPCVTCRGYYHSSAHKALISRYFGAVWGYMGRMDGLREVELVMYRTQRKPKV